MSLGVAHHSTESRTSGDTYRMVTLKMKSLYSIVDVSSSSQGIASSFFVWLVRETKYTEKCAALCDREGQLRQSG